MSKIDTCKHRSAEQVQYGPPCCTSRNIGWYCVLRGIHGITEHVCDPCELYEAKEVVDVGDET